MIPVCVFVRVCLGARHARGLGARDQHAVQLGQASGWIVEHAQDCRAIVYRQSGENLPGVERGKQRIRGVLEPSLEQELSQRGNVLFADGTPASLTRAALPGGVG